MSTYTYPNPQAIFYQQYNAARRDEVVGILLALFLGGFGVHHFYLRRTGLGILYICFCWTGIPSLLGFIECFFMPGRVREFNAIQAAAIAASLGIPVPGWGQAPVNVDCEYASRRRDATGGSDSRAYGCAAQYAPPPMQTAVATYPPTVAPAATCGELPARECGGRAILLGMRAGTLRTGNKGLETRDYEFPSYRRNSLAGGKSTFDVRARRARQR